MKRNYSKWTDQEKSKLIDVVMEQKQLGAQMSWIKVAQILTSKTPRQCYDQWLQLQKPKENEGLSNQWSQDQTEQLVELVLQHGSNWDLINQYFPTFPAAFLKSKYNQAIRTRQTGGSQLESSSNQSSLYARDGSTDGVSPSLSMPQLFSNSVTYRGTSLPFAESRLSQMQGFVEQIAEVPPPVVYASWTHKSEQQKYVQRITDMKENKAVDSQGEINVDFIDFDIFE
ncbi:Conserved_hypothetical protein [Hexamita inflata]|uniref:Myb-like DNA-binding domain-containing protein n=1 Tax=Hexamita inflata TaxID=28002 RepID=A0AA86P9P3_9EUKA|nr:Conserved hypothetical protein [Hexamita inflata]CAI9934418.1 Conserved hypothetical protein [Hexamita inflata]